MVMVDDTEGGAQVEASGLDTDSRDTVIASSQTDKFSTLRYGQETK